MRILKYSQLNRTKKVYTRSHRVLGHLLISVSLFTTISWSDICQAQGRVATVRQKLDPLTNFRRIELRVDNAFKANCRQKKQRVTCDVSRIPERFPELMIGLRGGNMAGIEVIEGKRRLQLVFTLKKKELAFQSKVLPYPTRWVLEFGVPLVLLGTVEEQFPFRPYPVPATKLGAKLPPPNLHELSPTSPENQMLNGCYRLWRERRTLEAIDACEAVVESSSMTPAGRMAQKIVAELWMGLLDPKDTEKLPKILRALEKAEAAATQSSDGARYALLHAQALEAVGYFNRSEMQLANATAKYEKTRSASYLLAARARLLMRLKEGVKAREVLRQLRELRSDQPTVGAALVALGELAYNEGNYVTAIGLFDNVKSRWPELLNANSTAVFQAAELCRLFDRADEAKEGYERFIKLPIKSIPDWMAKIRLLELLASKEPERAAQEFRKLALALEKTEAQDLAFIRFARLTSKASERRRILRSLAAAPMTPYVFEELTTLSIQQALEDGSLEDAYRYVTTIWRERPNAYVLKAAPILFERVLTLKLLESISKGQKFDVLKLYYGKRERFENHTRRGEVHLLVAKTLRELAMFSEARLVLQKGLGGRVVEREPNTAARLYLSMASVLRELKDKFRLGEVLTYLDDRYPKKFDDFDYWFSKAMHHWWMGELDKARKIIVYALNGPVQSEQRLSLMETLADLYLEMKKPTKATRALEALIKEHDRLGYARNDVRRRRARWRLCEIWMATNEWGTMLAQLIRFLEEYPEDGHRFEARYYVGRAFVELAMPDKAKRQWDVVAREDADGLFGRLSGMELKMLAWRTNQLERVLSQSQ